MTNNFHVNSDVDILYIPRAQGGRGLKSIQIAYESRIITLNQHLNINMNRNSLMSYIFHAEEQKIRRVANGLLEKYSITPVDNEAPKKIGQRYLKSKSIEKNSLYTNITMHGYIDSQPEKDTNIDHKVSISWTRNRFMKSDFEAYAFAIKEQEISTKFIKAKRAKDNMNITLDSKCRLCKTATEDIIHII